MSGASVGTIVVATATTAGVTVTVPPDVLVDDSDEMLVASAMQARMASVGGSASTPVTVPFSTVNAGRHAAGIEAAGWPVIIDDRRVLFMPP